ncbi:MAG: hypothetical protein LBI39_01670 [Puniceicoccales bacterium]|jgi:hypothetical protein|nr:hypothetical protein [Puniceicoccales bacterium]
MVHHLVRTRIGRWTIAAGSIFIAAACLSFAAPAIGAIPAIGGILLWAFSFTIGATQFGTLALFIANVVTLRCLRKGKELFSFSQLAIDAQVYFRRAELALSHLKKFDWGKLEVSESVSKLKVLAEKFIQAAHRDTLDSTTYAPKGGLVSFVMDRGANAAKLDKDELFHAIGMVNRIMRTVFELQDDKTLEIPAVDHAFEVLYACIDVVSGVLGINGIMGHEPPPFYGNMGPYFTGLADFLAKQWDPNPQFQKQSSEERKAACSELVRRQEKAVATYFGLKAVFPTLTPDTVIMQCASGQIDQSQLKKWKKSLKEDMKVFASGGTVTIGGADLSFQLLRDVPSGTDDPYKESKGSHVKLAATMGCTAVREIGSSSKKYALGSGGINPEKSRWLYVPLPKNRSDGTSSVPVFYEPIQTALKGVTTESTAEDHRLHIKRGDVVRADIGILGTRDADGNLWVARGIPGENNGAIITHPWCRLSADGPVDAQSQIDTLIKKAILFPGDDLKTRAAAAEKELEGRKDRCATLRNLAGHVKP